MTSAHVLFLRPKTVIIIEDRIVSARQLISGEGITGKRIDTRLQDKRNYRQGTIG